MPAPRRAALFLFAISALLLLGALGFQYLGGLAPCEMCWWQRYAHVAVLLVAGLAVTLGWRPLAWGAVAAMAVAAGLGLYHAGVERHWWAGATACTTPVRAGMSQADILNALAASPLVRCDQIPWQMLGLSMAGWNALISAVAAVAAALLLLRH